MENPTATTLRIRANELGRNTAGVIASLIHSEIKNFNRFSMEAFWASLINSFPDKISKFEYAKPFVPMTDDESKMFGQKIMRFGKFKDMKIDQIDKGYLEWFAEQPDDFKQDLQRYLASGRVKQE